MRAEEDEPCESLIAANSTPNNSIVLYAYPTYDRLRAVRAERDVLAQIVADLAGALPDITPLGVVTCRWCGNWVAEPDGLWPAEAMQFGAREISHHDACVVDRARRWVADQEGST